MYTGKTDLDLIDGFRAGDVGSFEELISRYSGKAFRMASRLTKSVEDAEEVLQDVFVTVYRKIDGFERKSSFSSWLYRVTFNSALMRLRKRRQDLSMPMEELHAQVQKVAIPESPHGPEGEASTMRMELSRALDAAIRELPDDYRAVFVLRDVDGLTSKEVARILKLTIPAVKSRLHRARLMLRRELSALHRDFAEKGTGPHGPFTRVVSNG